MTTAWIRIPAIILIRRSPLSFRSHRESHYLRTRIAANTEVCRNHLTPEVSLHLITSNCDLWHQPAEDCEFVDPYWAFYWPGGQALTRFVLDHPELFRDQSVLDVGSGCGATAIAAMMSGARQVTANDIDLVAIEAIHMNSALNRVSLTTNSEDLIGTSCDEWNVIFLGDMFYDEEFTRRVSDWIRNLTKNGKTVLIGDPERIYLKQHPLKKNLVKMFEIELLQNAKDENYGLTHGFVWQMTPDR